MTEQPLTADDPFPYKPGKAYPDWDCVLTPEYQAKKLACCDVDPALYGDRADISHYAFATVMSARRAGISINGRVHMTQSFDQSEPILLGKSLRVQGRTVDVAPDRRGHVITDRFEFVRPDGTVPLRAERQSLRLDPALTGNNRPSGAARRAAEDPTAGMRLIEEKQLDPEKVAAYSDEAENLIHSDPETARRFGYRAPIAAGLMAIRFMMAALSREIAARQAQTAHPFSPADVLGRAAGHLGQDWRRRSRPHPQLGRG